MADYEVQQVQGEYSVLPLVQPAPPLLLHLPVLEHEVLDEKWSERAAASHVHGPLVRYFVFIVDIVVLW